MQTQNLYLNIITMEIDKKKSFNSKIWHILWSTILFISPTGTWAQNDSVKTPQNEIDFSINLLAHGEACGGGLPQGAEENKSRFLLGRMRIIADYKRPGLQVHAVTQNLAIWGMKGNQAFNLYEGWAKISSKNGFFAQVGRVALSYDDEHIIGTNDFATAALSHDLIRVGYEGHGHQAHAIFCYNQNDNNIYNNTYYDDGAQYYKTMQTLWYHYDFPKFPLGVSLLFMNIGMQAGKINPKEWDYDTNPARTEYQQMFGGYINYHPKHLTLEASYYRQTGKQVAISMNASDIRAWMASVKATITPTDRYGFIVGYDHLSGDDYMPVPYGGDIGLIRHDVVKGFSPLYGSRTKFYGILDFFYESAYINGFTPGLQNVFIGAFGDPVKKLSCSFTYHYLATATALTNLNRTLGHSIEIGADYRFSKDITLSIGYTQMFGTETMCRLKQDESNKNGRWGWFSLVISPTVFSTKW